jgi:5-methylcytosine-specific restriction endonuclease McrA
MRREQYPENWREIAKAIKERDGWQCRQCGAEHQRPHPEDGSSSVMTVHHLGVNLPDGRIGDPADKSDCRPENLITLCRKCHLRADAIYNAYMRRYGSHLDQQRAGQLKLF